MTLHPTDPLLMARHHVEVEVGSSILADIGTVVTTKDEAAFDAKVVALKGKLARVETALGDGHYFIGPLLARRCRL